MFSHVVIFWTDPNNPKAADELIAGADKYLKPIPGTLHYHIGKMVPSHRPVVDQSYQVALNLVLAMDIQVAAVLHFIDRCLDFLVVTLAHQAPNVLHLAAARLFGRQLAGDINGFEHGVAQGDIRELLFIHIDKAFTQRLQRVHIAFDLRFAEDVVIGIDVVVVVNHKNYCAWCAGRNGRKRLARHYKKAVELEKAAQLSAEKQQQQPLLPESSLAITIVALFAFFKAVGNQGANRAECSLGIIAFNTDLQGSTLAGSQ